jgi:Lar family restriction alleviation protein
MKHCPFCGSEAVEITENKAQGYFCACTSCHGMINVYAETKEKAIAAWNQRHEAEAAAMREALEDAVPETDEWWCPTCKRAVDGKEVTFEDYHEICGTYLGEVNSPGWITKVQMALAPSAGKDLLEKVQRLEAEIKENERHIHMLQKTLPAGVVEKTLQLEAVAEAAKACLPLVRGFLVATDAKEGTEWSQAYLRLDQALAALEGGSHEQTD